MYDELINLLRRCGKQKSKNCEYEYVIGCVTKMNEEAADAIEQLSNAGSAYGRGWTLGYDAGREESKPRWIPVTERLPECYKWALGITDEHEMPIEVFYDGLRWQDCILNVEHVTHWMPLPEPPKEE